MFLKKKKEKKRQHVYFQKFNGCGIYRHVFLSTLNRTEFVTFDINLGYPLNTDDDHNSTRASLQYKTHVRPSSHVPSISVQGID